MFVVLGPTVFWVQCVCLITVLTLLVHVKQVLLVVDFATEELAKAHFVKPIFNFNVKLFMAILSCLAFPKGRRCYRNYGK